MLDTIVLRLHTHVLLQNQHLKKVGSLCIGSHIQDNCLKKIVFNFLETAYTWGLQNQHLKKVGSLCKGFHIQDN